MRIDDILTEKEQQLQLGLPDPNVVDCSDQPIRTEVDLLRKMACDAAAPQAGEKGNRNLIVDIGAALRGMREFESDKDWYVRHLQIVDQLFGQHKEIFYKFLAAASANTSPYWNAMYAIDAFLYWYQGGHDFNAFRRPATKGEGKLLPAHADSFSKIIADPNFIPTGLKISEFYYAISGHLNAIPIDRWMIRIFYGDVAANPRRIAVVKRIIVEWARHMGWQPAEVQAALWCWYISYTSGGRKEIQDYVKPLMQRAEDIKRVMSAPPQQMVGQTRTDIPQPAKQPMPKALQKPQPVQQPALTLGL